MAFPNDLSNVTAFKIHPAIGIARLSKGAEVFTYGDAVSSYKGADKKMKRQAVQFRVFAYGPGNNGLGELTAPVMATLGVQAVWRVTVANRKIAVQDPKDDAFEVKVSAASNANNGKLVGQLPQFQEGGAIPFGQISPTGLFTPAEAAVFYKTTGMAHPGGLHTRDVIDNTCDGPVTVELKVNNQPVNIPVFGAWIVVAPEDFSPDIDDMSMTLEDYLTNKLGTPGQAPTNPVNQAARLLDRAPLKRSTGTFAPGIETSFGGEINSVTQPFYHPNLTEDPDEIRVFPAAGGGVGVAPGQLSSGLCSPWQNDFLLCTCGWWPAQRPDTVYKTSTSQDLVDWTRKVYNETGHPAASELANPVEVVKFVDQLAVIREIASKPVETERTGDIS